MIVIIKIIRLAVFLLALAALISPRANAQLISGSVTFSTGGTPAFTNNSPSSGATFTGYGPNENQADAYEIASSKYIATPDNIPPNVTFAWFCSSNSQSDDQNYPISKYFASGFDDFGSEDGGSTVISLANGVSSITQITDASTFPLTSASLLVSSGDFLILKNITAGYSGYYGVVQLTSGTMQSDGTGEATFNWWLLTDGSADFSGAATPEPSTGRAMLVAALLSFGIFRYRKHRTRSRRRVSQT